MIVVSIQCPFVMQGRTFPFKAQIGNRIEQMNLRVRCRNPLQHENAVPAISQVCLQSTEQVVFGIPAPLEYADGL
ncbi:MAG: hypothetical protein DBY37_15015 [Desulfovibrionaceae bacterium]|nr:MAG: hypothetical protein DBY37_15015 [Desulfovibrionaceae bacterium]